MRNDNQLTGGEKGQRPSPQLLQLQYSPMYIEIHSTSLRRIPLHTQQPPQYILRFPHQKP